MYERFHYGLALVAKSFDIDISVLTKRWVEIYESRLKHRGKQSAVKFCKELNTICERYALKQPITPLPWTKSDKNGFPKCLGTPFKEFLGSSDSRKVVFALSVMRSCEELRLPISKDIGSITEPCNSDFMVLIDIIDFIPRWVSGLKPQTLPKIKYHYSVKSGPNGQALLNSDSDISAIMKSPELLEAIQVIETKLNDESPMELVSLSQENAIHSKIIQFPEKSGKTRTIAIIDYYSQRCLRPLHKLLMRTLKSLVSDGTYSHQNVGRFAQRKTKEKSFIFCADLTNFTDRFPAMIQKSLLNELLKDLDLSRAFWTLLAERTFTVAWSGEEVTYSCGQPMGAYSSWPLCSLAHHLLINYCAFKVGKPIKNRYRLIGDDVIITEPETAQYYEQTIKALGVEINYSKTVSSPALTDYSGAEVAKQLFLNGECFTPLTPGFIRNVRKPYMFNTCLGILMSRYDWFVPETPPMLIDSFYKGRKRQQVWLQCSNPMNGIVKPGNPGYAEHSPWVSRNLDRVRELYTQVLLINLLDKAGPYMSGLIQLSMGGADPWKDPSRPQPSCLRKIKSDLGLQLVAAVRKLQTVFTGEGDPQELLAEFDFVPDPDSPYRERRETRQHRYSSVIQSLYDFDDGTTFLVED